MRKFLFNILISIVILTSIPLFYASAQVIICSNPNVLQNGECRPCPPPTVYSGGDTGVSCITPAPSTVPNCIMDRTGQATNPPCRSIGGTLISPPGSASSGSTTSNYIFLAPFTGISGAEKNFNPVDNNALGRYLNLMIKIFIGLCAVLAVIMIVMGGIEYMTSELPGNKQNGRERITNALLGLLIALGTYALLNTINPQLLRTDVKILDTEITYASQDTPQIPINGKYADGRSFGALWNDSIGKNTPVCKSIDETGCLPAYVNVKSPECTFVGQPDCTSIRGFDPSALRSIQWGCECVLTITGGTETWLHEPGSSHKPGSSTVDLRATPKLDAYLSGGKPLINLTKYPPPDGPMYETTGGNHWHIGK